MKTSGAVKGEIIEHLNWCLEKLKFYDNGKNAENYERLYRDVFELKSELEMIADNEVCEFYRLNIMNSYLKRELKYYNIELCV